MSGIFISYRREETAPYAGRLRDRLVQEFGQDQVFMDIDTIALGVDFVKAIEEAVAAVDVLICVMGPEWSTITDESGKRRLDDPNDFIRLEVATALKRDIRVIPVLVRRATLPSAGQLPSNLKPLTRRNALGLDDARFHADVDRLIHSVRQVLPETRAARQTQPSTLKKQASRVGEVVRRPVKPSDNRRVSNGSVDRTVSWDEIKFPLIWAVCAALGVYFSVVLFDAMRIEWFGRFSGFVSGMAFGSLMAIGSALYLAIRRRRQLGGLELAIYWLGCGVTLFFFSVTFFHNRIEFFGPHSGEDSGVILASLTALGSGLYLALRRRKKNALSLPELAVYSLGGVLSLIFLFVALTGI